MSHPEVIVVGGGIAGLAAARSLLAGAAGIGVTLLESDTRLGGKLLSTPFGGLGAVDEGADAFLARVPWATALARDAGLGEQLTSPRASTAAVWWDGLHPIPSGLLLGMPTDLVALARTRLIPWRGKLRAATEPLLPRTSLDADSLGAFVRARFGNDVHERLVDPLVGSIYAADTDRFSLAAVAQIADLAGRARSVLLAGRHRSAPAAGPVFYAPEGGMAALADAVAADVVSAGATVLTGTPAPGLRRDGPRWRLGDHTADAVVLACPAAAAARLLLTEAPVAADVLGVIPAASVALVTMAVPAATWPERLRGMSGYLVPKPRQRHVTAVSFGSQKWDHWRIAGAEVLRVSLGRDGLDVFHLDDDALVAAAVTEVGAHLGLDLAPTETRVSRWPAAFPQYRPHHAARIESAQRALPASIALAGASYHGIGVPACVRSGQQAAARVLTAVGAVTR